jgi:hypothetical protein
MLLLRSACCTHNYCGIIINSLHTIFVFCWLHSDGWILLCIYLIFFFHLCCFLSRLHHSSRYYWLLLFFLSRIYLSIFTCVSSRITHSFIILFIIIVKVYNYCNFLYSQWCRLSSCTLLLFSLYWKIYLLALKCNL